MLLTIPSIAISDAVYAAVVADPLGALRECICCHKTLYPYMERCDCWSSRTSRRGMDAMIEEQDQNIFRALMRAAEQ